MKKIVKRKDFLYEIYKYVYNFQQYEAIRSIRSLAKNIFGVKTTLDNADKNQGDLLNDFIDSKKGTKPKVIQNKKLKRDTIESINVLSDSGEIILMLLKVE